MELAIFLLEDDDQVPADLLGQLEDRSLGVEGIQEQDIEETGTILSGDLL